LLVASWRNQQSFGDYPLNPGIAKNQKRTRAKPQRKERENYFHFAGILLCAFAALREKFLIQDIHAAKE
jgi:hypothetical protein